MKSITFAALGIDPAEVEHRITEGWGVPTRWYSDPEIHDFEVREIFSKSWQIAATRRELDRPGDIVACTLGNVPVVLTHARDGQIRAFVNVCRHRGFPVARDNGNGRTLACGYHGWTYGLDGALLAAPGLEGEPNFDRCALGLVPLSVHVWGPIVFVNPDPAAPAFDVTHPDFAGMIAERDFNTNLDDFRYETRIEYSVDGNWKLCYDNGTECYHCDHVHSGTFAAAFATEPGKSEVRNFGTLMTGTFHASAGDDPDVLRPRSYKSFQIYPGGIFIQQDEIMMVAQTRPTGFESTYFFFEVYSAKGADPERVQRWIALWRQTFLEDKDVVEAQQKSFRCGHVPYSRFVAAREAPVKAVNRLVWENYKRVLGRAS